MIILCLENYRSTVGRICFFYFAGRKCTERYLTFYNLFNFFTLHVPVVQGSFITFQIVVSRRSKNSMEYRYKYKTSRLEELEPKQQRIQFTVFQS
jgi:hypothetical protein